MVKKNTKEMSRASRSVSIQHKLSKRSWCCFVGGNNCDSAVGWRSYCAPKRRKVAERDQARERVLDQGQVQCPVRVRVPVQYSVQVPATVPFNRSSSRNCTDYPFLFLTPYPTLFQFLNLSLNQRSEM